MTRDEEVRLLELATQLVLGPLKDETRPDINDIGELLAAMTDRDREQIEKGERWQGRGPMLKQDEAREVLYRLNMYQLNEFANRLDYCLHEIFEWAIGHRAIPDRAVTALGDAEEMVKITGETR
jgi:hypothetical protein